jgi:hypothetical protein
MMEGTNGDGGVQTVEEWLRSIVMEHLVKNFEEKKYNSLLLCSALDERDLDELGIQLRAERKALLLQSSILRENLGQRLEHLKLRDSGNKSPKVKWQNGALKLSDFWDRAKPRSEPFDYNLPRYGPEKPKLRILLVRHGESLANINTSTTAQLSLLLSLHFLTRLILPDPKKVSTKPWRTMRFHFHQKEWKKQMKLGRRLLSFSSICEYVSCCWLSFFFCSIGTLKKTLSLGRTS